MVRRVACFLTLTLVSVSLVVSMDARSWDLAVAVGHQIDFYSKNGTATGSFEVSTANSVTSLAYDSKTQTMYIGDADTNNISIFRDNLNKLEPKVDPLWKSDENSYVTAVVFDPVNETLFWIDASKNVLMKMKPNENSSQAIPLHNLTGSRPWGLAIDICNRYIYWTNKQTTVHTIERSKLDGSERSVIVKDDLYKPYGVTIDYESGKLYWTNTNPGVHYTIGRSNLDGSERELVLTDTHYSPSYIAVDRDTIYWSDQSANAIWKMAKTNGKNSKKMFKSYAEYQETHQVNSVITRDNSDEIDCEVILEKQKNRLINKNERTPLVESSKNLTASSEKSNLATQPKVNCLHGGDYDPLTSSCRCKKGFTGSYCEHYVCDGFCLNNGTCSVSSSISDESTATCSCKEGFKGLHCEHNICDGFCLNNGTCSVSSNFPNGPTATCSCKKGFKGPNCEREICDDYCLNNGTCSVSSSISDESTATCSCKEGFKGLHCEHNICDGFCLNNGTCSVSSNVSNGPTATCSCKEGFKGPNCERKICDGYCLNNGTCSVSSNGEPSCKCGNFRGSRCEYPNELDKLCVLYCMGTDDVLNTSISTFCRCDKLTGSIPEDNSEDIEPSTQSTIILSVLIAVIGTLTIVVGVLSYHVHKLKRRPRIRKRFVVSKGGVTPLTSRPQVPADSCEITIENCCNMNICETPCFEPKLRTPPTKSKNTKKEEKNLLLDSVEGADSC